MSTQMDEIRERRRVQAIHDFGLRTVKLADVLLVTLPFIVCWITYYSGIISSAPTLKRSSVVIALFVALYFWFGRVYDAFIVSLKRISEMIFSQALSVLMADAFMIVVLWLMGSGIPRVGPIIVTIAVQLLLSVTWCRLAHQWYFAHYAGQRTGIVYDTRRGMEDLFGEYGLDKKFDIQFTCTVDECLQGNMEALNGLEIVFLCGVHSHERNIILKYCVEHDIIVYMIPRIGDVMMSGAKRMHMFHLPILRVDRYRPPVEFIVIKRFMDIAISLVGIVLTSPIMLFVALAIKGYDRGPVLYRQVRLTKDRREFEVLKFRSMRTDAEKDGVARLSTGENDDRITPIGRFIRACRLDELPQLFNILRGDMSLVGPRPERPEIAEQYEKEMPEFALRLQAKAGLTGYAQVYGKYNTQPYDKLQMDLMYISNPSILEDLRIIFATIQVLFMKESTEGIGVGQRTAGDAGDEEKSA